MSAEKCFAVKSDLASTYADKANITCKEAKKRIDDVIELIVHALENPSCDGVMFRNFFTIEKVVKSARVGKMPINGVEYKTPSAQKLKINTGKIVSELLNVK